MAKVKFTYNLKKDAWSWVMIAKAKDLWGLKQRDQIAHISDDLLAKIQKSSYYRAQEIVAECIKKDPFKRYKNKIMSLERRSLEETWRMVEKNYFTVLSDITQQPIFAQTFTCYFTTGLMCPYSEKERWFMASIWHSLPSSITTICHEVMHLQFLYYYRDYLHKQGLKNNQIEDLKEALTFLLNEPEFFGIVLCEDSGYPDHQELRKELRKIWLKEKDFPKLIDQAILLIKAKV